MAVVKNDPFPGTDYSQYLSWQKVTAPDGSVYYIVPGYPGYVYDPVASNATGRKVFRRNPQQQFEEQQAEKDRVAKEQELREQAASPAGQLVPVAATVGGTLAANQLMSTGIGKPPVTAVSMDPKTGNVLMTDGSIKYGPGQGPPISPQANAAAQGATSGGITETNIPLDGSAAEAPVPVETTPDGSTEFSDGTTVKSDGSVWRGGVQIVGGAAQAYTGYQQIQDGQKIGGTANLLGGGYNMYAGYQAATGGAAPAWGAYVAPAVAAAQIGQQIANTEGNSEDRAAASQAEAQKAMLLAIPGYGWAAYAALAAGDAATGGKFTEQWARANKNLDKFNDRIDFGIGKSIRSKVFHQSTRGVQKEHTGQLLEQSDDPQWQQYIQGMRAQHQEGPPDPSKPFKGGTYATWDEYKAAGLDANDLTGVYGNLDAFKPDWAEKAGMPDWSKLTFEQQRAVTQELINADLYESKKGEVVVKDKDKAREIYSRMAANGFGVSATAPQSAPTTTTQGATPVTTGGRSAPITPTMNGGIDVKYNPNGAQPGALPANASRPAPLSALPAAQGIFGGQPLPPQTLTPEQMAMMNQAFGGIVGPWQNLPQPISAAQMSMMPSTQAQAAAQAAMVAAQPPRSSTLSPGIGLDGRPIVYGRR